MIVSGNAVVESRVPGRVRFRFPKEHRHPSVFEEAASIFGGADGVLDVLSNPGTGSLLVLNDPDVLDEDGLLDIARDARIVSDAERELEEAGEGQWPETSELARSIMQGFRRYDRFVGHLTNGVIDGKTLIILLLFGSAMSRVLLGRKQPPAPWYALMWYGYSAFVQWHKPGAADRMPTP